jgi:hypothetical protein
MNWVFPLGSFDSCHRRRVFSFTLLAYVNSSRSVFLKESAKVEGFMSEEKSELSSAGSSVKPDSALRRDDLCILRTWKHGERGIEVRRHLILLPLVLLEEVFSKSWS